MIRALLCSMLLLALSGCHTMHFVNGERMSREIHATRLHHSFIYGLIEGSAPFDPNEICTGGWNTVTTGDSILTALLGFLDQALLEALLSPAELKAAGAAGVVAIDVWDPQRIQVRCGRSN